MNNVLKWTATVGTLVGASLTSLDIYPINVYFLTVSTVLWTIWSIRIKENSLIVVNFGMIAIYVIGLFI